MLLLVQEYLLNHTFTDLVREHGVYASFSKSGHKFSLNYDQLEAMELDPLAQECRGLILALPDGRPIFGQIMPDGKLNRDNIWPGETVVMAFPMRRFFNYGQGAAQINWNDPNLAVLEKLDGSLIILYYDQFNNNWCAATRAVPEADLLMDNGKFTFRTLFEKALKDTTGLSFEEYVINLNKDITYCFELTTPYNAIVVKYNTCSITLLAARLINTFQELNINFINTFGVPRVKSYNLASIEDIHNYVSNQSPLEHEGVVVLDSYFDRIKVKNPAYVIAHKMNDTLGASDRNCMELIMLEKDDDAMPFLAPELQDNLLEIKRKYKNWLDEEERMYNKVYLEAFDILPNDKKTFALTVNKYNAPFKSAFFSIFDKKSNNIKDFIIKNKKEGTWPNSFLDKILESINI